MNPEIRQDQPGNCPKCGMSLEPVMPALDEAGNPELLGVAAKTARRIKADGQEEDVPLAYVHEGDRLRVRPGEKVLTDGVVEEGSGSLVSRCR